MAINVTLAYKLGTKKETVEAYLNGELNQTEAAAALGVKRQNFQAIVTNIIRQMVMESPEFAKAFSKHFKNY